MKRAAALVLLVALLTAGICLLLSPSQETLLIMYHHAPTIKPPLSTFCSRVDDQRLELQYVAKQQCHTIIPSLISKKNQTTVSLLFESPKLETAKPILESALMEDDLGHHYHLLDRQPVVLTYQPEQQIWHYVLSFSPLHPEANNLAIRVQINNRTHELTGATLP